MKHDESDDSVHEHPALARLKAHVRKFGCTCTSTEWLGHEASYAFVCSKGHAFQRTAGTMLYGKPSAPCPECTRQALYKRLQILANWKGGTCLETDYLGPQAMHRMRCANAHEWQADGRSLLAGSWCPTCASAGLTAKRVTQANTRDKWKAMSTRTKRGKPISDSTE